MSQPVDGMLGGKVNSKLGSAGVLLPGMFSVFSSDEFQLRHLGCEARLCKEAAPGTPMEEVEEVAPGEPGELYVRSGTTALGYWGNEKATKETFLADQWLRTGDRVRADCWVMTLYKLYTEYML
jgi:long-subunit acyl-CoA synthetase (AMP-forming)